jgi:hypothetical protein
MTTFNIIGLLAVAIILGSIGYIYNHYNSQGKKLSVRETAIRNLKSSCILFGIIVVPQVILFEFGNRLPTVPENIQNIEQVQKILLDQNRYIENLRWLFFYIIFCFFLFLLPSIYSFAKTAISTQDRDNILVIKEETNILGLREDEVKGKL